MAIPAWIEKAFYGASDFLMQHPPKPASPPADLNSVRLVAHRGVFDNRRVLENTLAAFNRVRVHGIWGIEFDIRWTADFQPVVFHDPDFRRLSAARTSIEKLPLQAVKERFPMIPTLAEVVRQFGGRLHLMAELKPHHIPAGRVNEVLSAIFSPLSPVTDFHLLSFSPELFSGLAGMPVEAMVLIAETNVAAVAETVIQRGYGGMAGHYLLIRKAILTRLSRHGIPAGTGFINSENCLYREMNRGITWLFSDRAVQLQRLVTASARAPRPFIPG